MATTSGTSSQRKRTRRKDRLDDLFEKDETITDHDTQQQENSLISSLMTNDKEDKTIATKKREPEDPLSALLTIKPIDDKSETTLNDERAFDKIEFQFEEFKQYKLHNLPRFGKIKQLAQTNNNNNNQNNQNYYGFDENEFEYDNYNSNYDYYGNYNDNNTQFDESKTGNSKENSNKNKNNSKNKDDKKMERKHNIYTPDYFIALKISNLEMKRKLSKIQKILIDKWLEYDSNILLKCNIKDEKTFRNKIMIDESLFHITLNTIYCNNNDSLGFEILNQFNRFGQTIFQKLVPYKLSVKLTISNLSYFKNGRVIFACIKDDKDKNKLKNVFYALKTLFDKHLNNNNNNNKGKKGIIKFESFEPHLTILNLKKLNNSNIQYPIQLFDDIITQLNKQEGEINFGSQFVTKLDFCVMHDQRDQMSKIDENNYYQCISSIEPNKLRPGS